jgi:hypothetical protein
MASDYLKIYTRIAEIGAPSPNGSWRFNGDSPSPKLGRTACAETR